MVDQMSLCCLRRLIRQLKVKNGYFIQLVIILHSVCLSGYLVDSSVSKPNGEPMCTLMYVCQTFTSKLDQIYWNVEIVFAKELDVLTNVRERFHARYTLEFDFF